MLKRSVVCKFLNNYLKYFFIDSVFRILILLSLLKFVKKNPALQLKSNIFSNNTVF